MDPSESEKDEVLAAIRNEKWDEAIALALRVFQVETSSVKGEIVFDGTLPDDGATYEDGLVSIGRSAFRSVAWLASTLAHEAEVHARQIEQFGFPGHRREKRLYDWEAYQFEIEQASRFGLSDMEVRELEYLRDQEWHGLRYSVRDMLKEERPYRPK